MIETYSEKQTINNDDQLDVPLVYWQQQLLGESLFSRHELIRTLYRHPKQSASLQKDGYVVHQHSYESLGRHYVLVFYGQEATGHNSKAAVQPKLAQIAKDVATRLPIIELHHIIVLGIDFITEADETFIDIDLWIQPVDTMTQRERQLTKQLQRLKHQDIHHQNGSSQPDQQTASNTAPANKDSKKDSQADRRPQVHLNLSIPARKKSDKLSSLLCNR